ncbi:MAG: NuoM family protein [Verrucomicrobiales bacterium]
MILAALIIVPLVAAVAVAVGAPARLTSLVAAGINAALAMAAALSFHAGDPTPQLGTTLLTVLSAPELKLSLGVDGLALAMVLLTAVVTLGATLACPGTVTRGSLRLYYICVLLIAAGALGAFVSTDLFFFYAFHELALIPTFIMIGLYGTGDRRTAAWKITVYLGLGSLVLLAGLAALFLNLGGTTFDMDKLAAAARTTEMAAGTQAWIFLVLVVGFGVLISLFPFHSWAPGAYACAPTPVAMLHAGVLKKFGLYGLIKVALPMLPSGSQSEWVLNLLLFALLGNILWIGLVTIAQRELDLMLGHSSVMHMGYVFLGIASHHLAGLSGAVLLMVAHGLSIALLFFLNGHIRSAAGTTHFDRFGGLAKHAPKLGLMFGLATFAGIGLPGFANFAGELLVFFGAFKNAAADGALWLPLATILALWGVVMSAVYGLRAYRSLFMGEPSANAATVPDLTARDLAVALIFIVPLVLLGFFPNLILHFVRPALAALTGQP